MDSTTALLGTRCTQPNVYEVCESISTGKKVCHFLNLPLEIVLNIVNYLQPDSKLVLSLTCSPLRNIIYHGCQFQTDLRFWHDRKMTLRFLNCVGKERLDVWVCNYCLCFHRRHADSVPSASAFLRPCCPSRGFRELDTQTLVTYQREHVLVALKYARMQSSLDAPYEQHQRLLMQTHSGEVDSPDYERVTFRVIPRIVEGRFLVFKERVCESQTRRPLRIFCGWRRTCRQLWWWPVDTEFGPWTTFIEQHERLSSQMKPLDLEHVCSCGKETRIEQFGTTIRIRTWEDLGTEFSSLNMVHFYDYGFCDGAERVREVYESTIEDLDLFYATQGVRERGAEPQDESQKASNQAKPRRHEREKRQKQSDKSDTTEKKVREATRCWARVIKGWINMLLGFLSRFSVRHKVGSDDQQTVDASSLPHQYSR